MFQLFSKDTQKSGAIKTLVGSSVSFFISDLYNYSTEDIFFIGADEDTAKKIFSDLTVLFAEKKNLFLAPGASKNTTNQLLQIDAIEHLSQTHSDPSIYVSHLDAFLYNITPPNEYEKVRIKLSCGDTISVDSLIEELFELSFNQTARVTKPGDFSLRGQILDVFSFSHPQPFRIIFSEDTIKSIRSIDLESQLSIKNFNATTIIPDIKDLESDKIPWIEALSAKTQFVILDTDSINTIVEKKELFKETETHTSWTKVAEELKTKNLIELNSCFFFDDYLQIVDTTPQPSFHKNFEILNKDLLDYQEKDYQCTICCSNEKQELRMREILKAQTVEIKCDTKVLPIQQGFVAHNSKHVVYTDSQIFDRYQKPRSKSGYNKAQQISPTLKDLEAGDYVVHIDHGIGQYAGLQKIEVNGKYQEVIKLIYAEGDTVYVSIHLLHKVSKYRSKDGEAPKLNKLGSKKWDNIKQKTKKKVKEIAYDLLKVYAKRQISKGFAFGQDTLSQKELEASFFYEDTEDQWQATEAVKRDMESDLPMDRLICGDVGFGKTEIAIRAVFKAVDNGKQVAVLVPTTILAFQHYQTFKERLKDFPINIAYLNRSITAHHKKEILEGLQSGSVDVVIGTHILSGDQVTFKDLGLLVIDEEQKFGVAVKDKLKAMKESVDTLALSATPIPRTLQFSLTTVRDMSVIRTPPSNRYPITTKVIQFNKTVIKEAIKKELARGGQILFVYNRVNRIKEMELALSSIVPSAKIAIGHGQMPGGQLEKIMVDFINHKYDILLATTIIENGLDVPNANTIFVYNAHLFGLSELHQMRGRVGRSNRKAHCYFITPDLHELSDIARKRIKVVEEFSSLGSGFNIAMKDLELRGAGDLLGGEQSGFINEIGFETYQQILAETVEELKSEGEIQERASTDMPKEEKFVAECILETDLEILLPNSYINATAERLKIYQELYDIDSEEKLKKFTSELEDRFGPIPDEGRDLLLWIQLKPIAEQLGFEKIILKNSIFLGLFSTKKDSRFYDSLKFANILDFIQSESDQIKLSEKKSGQERKLFLRVNNIEHIESLYLLLNKIHNHVSNTTKKEIKAEV